MLCFAAYTALLALNKEELEQAVSKIEDILTENYENPEKIWIAEKKKTKKFSNVM